MQQVRRSFVSVLALAAALGGLLPTASAQTPAEAGPRNDRSAQAMAELMKLPPEQQHDCLTAGFVAMFLPPLYMPDLPAATRLKAADKVAEHGQKMQVPRIQKNFAIIAEEIRIHAADAPFKPAKMEAAGNDILTWMKETCPNAKGR